MAGPAETIRFEPLKEHIGATVVIDKADLLNVEVVAACRTELDRRGVLVFPQINLTDEEQLAFTDLFGARGNYTLEMQEGADKADDVYRVTLDESVHSRPEMVRATFFWHVDGAVVDQQLPKGTLLSARALSKSGGQTEFGNLYAAFEQLPDEEQEALAGLMVKHRLATHMRDVIAEDEVIDESRMPPSAEMLHPLVWTHESGRRSLILGRHADTIVDMPYAEGRALLQRLLEWAAQPDFTYRHEWTVGDLVIWDNHGVMHRVVPYDDPARNMHRTTIAGGEASQAA